LLSELRQALRRCRSHRLSATAILVMVALGAGASGAAVSLTKNVLIDPIGVPEPSRLVALRGALPDLEGQLSDASSILDYKPLLRGFSDAAAYSEHDGGANIRFKDAVVRARGAEVSSTFFDTLDVRLESGRGFVDDDLRSGRNRVLVVSDGLRRRLFRGNETPLGAVVTLNEIHFTIIGVVPQTFRFPKGAEFWVPISRGADRVFRGPAVSYGIFGRLSPGTTISQAQSDIELFVRAAADRRPNAWPTRREIVLLPLAETIVGPARQSLQILGLALALVWFAALANVVTLLKTRMASMRSEWAVRWALGASRWGFARHACADAVLVGGVSLAVGWLGAFVALGSLPGLLPQQYGGSTIQETPISTLGLVALLSLFTGLLTLIPVLRLHGTDVRWVTAGLRDSAGIGRRLRHRRPLVIIQVAVATILIAGTIAIGRSLVQLHELQLGFEPRDAFTFSISETRPGFSNQVSDELVPVIRQMPGVIAAGATTSLPLDGSDSIGLLYSVVGARQPKSFEDRFALTLAVTPGYFQAAGMPILSGRSFNDNDTHSSEPVVIVNRSLSNRYGGLDDILGKRMTLPGREHSLRVVGVIEDVRHLGLVNDPGAQIYVPLRQRPSRVATIVVRTSDSGSTVRRNLRSVVAGVDPSLVVFDIAPLEDVVRRAMGPQPLLARLFAIFACLAIVLAGVAAYVAVTQYVTSHRRDISVRRALGAGRTDIAMLVVRQAFTPCVIGLVIGTVASVVLLRLGAANLSGLEQPGVVDYAITIAVLCVLSVIGAAPPAAVASRIDPARVLREG
jgi:putative ABC transport system permease protein